MPDGLPAIQVPGRSGGLKISPDSVPTVKVPWAGGSKGRLIPPEARGISSNSTDGLPAIRAPERRGGLKNLPDGVPAVQAPRIHPACAANNPVEGRAHATLPALQAGPSSATVRESTPALPGVLPPLGGDSDAGLPLRGRASCLRNGPNSPALVSGWAANRPTRRGAVRRGVCLSLIPSVAVQVQRLPYRPTPYTCR